MATLCNRPEFSFRILAKESLFGRKGLMFGDIFAVRENILNKW